MEQKKKKEETLTEKITSTLFHSLSFFQPKSFKNKIPRYIKEIEKFSAEAKERPTPDRQLLQLLGNYELHRGEEEKSSIKPKSAYEKRRAHIKFSQLFTKSSQPVAIHVFFKQLTEQYSEIPADNMKEDPFFGRIVAWLYYFEPYLIANNIDIPANFKEALTAYKVDYFLELINQASDVDLRQKVIIELPNFFTPSDLSQEQLSKIIETLFSLSKLDTSIKWAAIVTLGKLAAHSNVNTTQRQRIGNLLLSNFPSSEKRCEEFGALLGTISNSDDALRKDTFISLSLSDVSRKDVLKGLATNLIIKDRQCTQIIDQFETEGQLDTGNLNTNIIEILKILGTSPDLSNETCRRITGILSRYLDGDCSRITKHEAIGALADIIQVYHSTIIDDQGDYLISILEKLASSTNLDIKKDAIYLLTILTTHSKMSDKWWETFFKSFSDKLQSPGLRDNAMNGLAMLAASPRMNKTQCMKLANSIGPFLKSNPYDGGYAINAFGILVASPSMDYNERNDFFSFLLSGLKEFPNRAIQIFLKFVDTGEVAEHCTQIISTIIDELQTITHNAPEASLLMRLSQKPYVSDEERENIRLFFLKAFNKGQTSNIDQITGLWINSNTTDADREMMIATWMKKLSPADSEAIMHIWKEHNTSPKMRVEIIEDLLKKSDTYYKPEASELLQSLLNSDVDLSKITITDEQYKKIIQLPISQYSIKIKVSHGGSREYLKLSKSNSALMCETATTLCDYPLAQIGFMSNLKQQSETLRNEERENLLLNDVLDEFMPSALRNIVKEYRK